MDSNIEQYFKQFKSEQLELIVRIDWYGERSEFDRITNCYEARARFDMALNVKTGELLDTRTVNWLK